MNRMQPRHKELIKTITKRFVLPETILLVTLCTWDMLYTLYCVRTGVAREQNPILKGSLDQSNWAFLLLKGATFLVPIWLLEIIRTIRPKFVTSVMRCGFLAYAAIYIGGSILVSVPL